MSYRMREERERFYNRKKWKTFRDAIIDDRKNCQCCGKPVSGKDAHVHHDSYGWIKGIPGEQYIDEEAACNEAIVFLSCRSCHYKYHNHIPFRKITDHRGTTIQMVKYT